MNVYIVAEELRMISKELIETISKMFEDVKPVNILVGYPPIFYNGSTNTISPNFTTGYYQSYPITAGTAITSTITGGASTVTTTASTTNIGTPYTTTAPSWQFYPSPSPTTVAAPQLGPIQVEEAPAEGHFEKMVRSNIELINTAYLLGREHGVLEGIKTGAEQITRAIDDIMDTEILEDTEEVPLALAI
jgi:hypothetical protein